MFIHGDIFDNFISKYPIITEIAANFYYFLQRVGFSKSFCRWIKSKSKSWLKASENVADKALNYIREDDINTIISGHVHVANFKRNPITLKNYWNCGSFCDDPCHYLVIKEDSGEILLKEI